MASTRLFVLSSNFFCSRRRRNQLAVSSSFLPLSLSRGALSLGRFPFPQIRRIQFFSYTSTPAISCSAAPAPSITHPWPEWDLFVNKIASKGYFEAVSSDAVDDEGDVEGFPLAMSPLLMDSGIALNANKLKNACLKFARERFDILRSLPMEDIRTVIECGCPNLMRKPVNSAKRLRAFLGIDEADACAACSFRDSCDRAYKIVHEKDEARTVDVMRILLSYAGDPAALSGGENSLVKVQVQESACRLLSELTKLSDTAIDPSLPKPIFNLLNQKGPSNQLKTTNKKARDIEMKTGDWLCSNCNFLNFARNFRCLECKADGPRKVDSTAMKMKPGDWTCQKCNFMNYARNRKCFRCLEQRPKRDLNPGEWECPKCDFVNFGRNLVCKKCDRDRPREEGSALVDHVWRKQGNNSTKYRDFNHGDSEEDERDGDNEDAITRELEKIYGHPTKRTTSSAGKRQVS